jgi:hypothetical protein
MTKPNLKIDSAALSDSAARIRSKGEESKSHTESALHGVGKLGATAGHKVFAALVDGVLEELKAQLPEDISRLIGSYADALLDLQGATGAADQALAQRFRAGGAESSGAAHGLAVVAVGGGVGALLQGGSSALQGGSGVQGRGLQSGSVTIQGQGARGASISTSPAASDPKPISKLSSIGLSRGDANQSTLDKYTAWLNDPKGGQAVRDRRGDSGNDVDCTTWAIWRRSQIDPGAPMTDQQLYFGNGIDVAGHFSAATGPDDIGVGSLISSGPGPYGHVMVVEEVISRHPLQLRMSEANLDARETSSVANISTSTILTYNGAGTEFTGGSWTIQRPGAAPRGLDVKGISQP